MQYNKNADLGIIRANNQFNPKKKVKDIRNVKDKHEKGVMEKGFQTVTWNGSFLLITIAQY